MSFNNLGFNIKNIDVIVKAIMPRPEPVVSEMVVYSFDIFTESSIHKENKNVFNFVKLSIREADNPYILATFTIVCIFEVDNFDEKVKLTKEGLYAIEPDLEKYMKSAALSTARGIVWSDLRGTYLHNAIMPILDVRTLSTIKERKIVNEGGQLLDIPEL